MMLISFLIILSLFVHIILKKKVIFTERDIFDLSEGSMIAVCVRY